MILIPRVGLHSLQGLDVRKPVRNAKRVSSQRKDLAMGLASLMAETISLYDDTRGETDPIQRLGRKGCRVDGAVSQKYRVVVELKQPQGESVIELVIKSATQIHGKVCVAVCEVVCPAGKRFGQVSMSYAEECMREWCEPTRAGEPILRSCR